MSNRRTFMKGAAAATVAAAMISRGGLARAADFDFKLANGFPASHPLNLRSMEAIGRIRDQSGGRLNITLFPGSQLGADTDSLSQLRSGALELYASSSGVFSSLTRVASIGNMPFIWADPNAMWPHMDGELGGMIKSGFSELGLIQVGTAWDNGFRQITSSTKPITSVEDLSGFKIRVPNSPVNLSLFKALGASPVTINIPELYSALQTGIVDGQENPLSIIEGNRLHEVQKFCAISNHTWDAVFVVANRGIWERLPADLQAIVERNFSEAGMMERSDVPELEATTRKRMEEGGLKFNTVDRAPFREKLIAAGFYGEWKEKFPPEAWSALEKSVGKLA